jgi:hypothetical protein
MFSLVYIFFIFLFLIQNVENNDNSKINGCKTPDPRKNNNTQNVNQ